MKLREDWKKILRYAWSIRFNLLATLFGLFEIALPIIDEMIYIPRGWFLAAALICNFLANIARVISQKEFKDGK